MKKTLNQLEFARRYVISRGNMSAKDFAESGYTMEQFIRYANSDIDYCKGLGTLIAGCPPAYPDVLAWLNHGKALEDAMDSYQTAFTLDGHSYVVTDAPYADNRGTDGEIVYRATALRRSEPDRRYRVTWRTTEAYDRGCEYENLQTSLEMAHYDPDLYHQLEAELDEMERSGRYDGIVEESEACDWTNPWEVTEL